MFNLAVIKSTKRAATLAFGKMRSFLSINIMRVLNILLMCKQFQIVKAVIDSVKVFMVYFQSTFNRPNKGFPQSSVNPKFGVFAMFTRSKTQIVI